MNTPEERIVEKESEDSDDADSVEPYFDPAVIRDVDVVSVEPYSNLASPGDIGESTPGPSIPPSPHYSLVWKSYKDEEG